MLSFIYVHSQNFQSVVKIPIGYGLYSTFNFFIRPPIFRTFQNYRVILKIVFFDRYKCTLKSRKPILSFTSRFSTPPYRFRCSLTNLNNTLSISRPPFDWYHTIFIVWSHIYFINSSSLEVTSHWLYRSWYSVHNFTLLRKIDNWFYIRRCS